MWGFQGYKEGLDGVMEMCCSLIRGTLDVLHDPQGGLIKEICIVDQGLPISHVSQ